MSIVQNPLFTGADPFLLCHEGVYYMYFTGGAEKDRPGFLVYSSTDLQNWENRGYCLEAKDVMGDCNFWAPELLYRDGKFYMVYVANEHLGVAVADSPLGPFKQEEKKWLSERHAIDGHFLVDGDGQTYLYYVRFDNANVIYAAKMSDDLMSIDEENEVRLIDAEEEWETRDCRVAEGPFVLQHNGLYYLTENTNAMFSCKVLQAIDLEFMQMLGEAGIPFSIIYTKADKLGPNALKTNLEKIESALLEYWEELPPRFITSSEKGIGRDEVLNYIENILQTV